MSAPTFDQTNLGHLVDKIELTPVTTAQVADARTALERYAGDNAELTLWGAMLGIDDTGLAEGLERGTWVQA